MPKIDKYLSVLIAIVFIMINACGSKDYYPKPKGYNRIELPEHAYKHMPDTLPYKFEISNQAQLIKDSSWNTQPYWTILSYPEHKAMVEFTYYPVNDDEKFLRSIITDAYTLTSKHQVKASAIEESIVQTPNGKTASISELEGEVPSQVQFFVTDSSKHFLRGALYFQTSTKNDSLAPVINYIKKDILHLLNTLQWKEEYATTS
ncbi:gliding motility lipoprotein GldD [Aureibacter tunicatorum]|uniref:Gliding motility-associated lipoprotein GldD n=1 Tax=Aureibacter tunicatorum TaxID=866807 RepID=A0AAE3XJV5_9BACT|nr:gliding motility lipoprotein GldD [Aureibacter tunicatorum]MDR6237106.1 gliding motility-associated lipoprotein GldD [Aureibacter tunicatorum]BDD06098.1 gliding motility lipoprotein GldD [Aureibacter tunicatorum]